MSVLGIVSMQTSRLNTCSRPCAICLISISGTPDAFFMAGLYFWCTCVFMYGVLCHAHVDSALDRDDEHMAMYVVFRAALRFHEKHGHLPGKNLRKQF